MDPPVGKDTLLCIIVPSNVVLVTAVDGNSAGDGISVEWPCEVHVSVENIADLGKVVVSPGKRTEIVKLKVRLPWRLLDEDGYCCYICVLLLNTLACALARFPRRRTRLVLLISVYRLNTEFRNAVRVGMNMDVTTFVMFVISRT